MILALVANVSDYFLSISLSRKSVQQLQAPSNETERPTETGVSTDKGRAF